MVYETEQRYQVACVHKITEKGDHPGVGAIPQVNECSIVIDHHALGAWAHEGPNVPGGMPVAAGWVTGNQVARIHSGAVRWVCDLSRPSDASFFTLFMAFIQVAP
jgi:hypothetical protein